MLLNDHYGVKPFTPFTIPQYANKVYLFPGGNPLFRCGKQVQKNEKRSGTL